MKGFYLYKADLFLLHYYPDGKAKVCPSVWFGDHWETASDVQATREHIEETIENLPDWVRDFIYDDSIDWEELEGHVECELT